MSELRDEILSSCETQLVEQIKSIVRDLSEGDPEENRLGAEQVERIAGRFGKTFNELFSKGFDRVFRAELLASSSSSCAEDPVPAADLTITDEDLTQVDDAMTHVGARR